MIVVLGAGESGVGAAVLAKKQGLDVFVSDKGEIKENYKKVLSHHEIQWEEGKHSEDKILAAQQVVKSPGIPDNVSLIEKIRSRKTPVISEIEFAAQYTNAKLIGVTGSNGKTTTSMLLYFLLKNAGVNVGLAGNIGQSFALQVAKENYDHYVLELSSFQLDGMEKTKLDIAVLLNITPDHLDRYENKMQNYVDSKFRITQNQSAEDVFIFCADDPIVQSEILKREIQSIKYPFSLKRIHDEGAYEENENLILNINNKRFNMSIHDLALQGKHNTYNSMAAGIAGKVLEIRKEIIRESLSDFQNVEHRLEFVAKVHGIEFVNDSKATNVNSTWYALESMMKPVIWIVGGVDKGNDYSELLPLVKDKVTGIVCLGKNNGKIHEAFAGVIDNIVDASSAQEAVAASYQLAKKGQSVLLSPACASFDLFENYEDRGNQFKRAVKAL